MLNTKTAIIAAIARNSESGNGEADNVPLPVFTDRWVEGETEGWEVVRHMPSMLPTLPAGEQWLVLATGIGHDCIADFGNWVEDYCPAAEFLPETPETLIAEYTPPGWHDADGREVAALSLYRAKHPDFIAFVDRYTDEWDLVTWLYRAPIAA